MESSTSLKTAVRNRRRAKFSNSNLICCQCANVVSLRSMWKTALRRMLRKQRGRKLTRIVASNSESPRCKNKKKRRKKCLCSLKKPSLQSNLCSTVCLTTNCLLLCTKIPICRLALNADWRLRLTASGQTIWCCNNSGQPRLHSSNSPSSSSLKAKPKMTFYRVQTQTSQVSQVV